MPATDFARTLRKAEASFTSWTYATLHPSESLRAAVSSHSLNPTSINAPDPFSICAKLHQLSSTTALAAKRTWFSITATAR